MKKFFATALILSAFAVLSAKETATVKASILNVRIRNNSSCDVITQLKQGDTVEVLSMDKQWAKIVTPESARVFVSSKYFKDGVTTSDVQLRCGAGTNFQSYGIVPAGTKLTVVKELNNGWTQVKPLTTMASYVAAEYLQITSVPSQDKKIADSTQTDTQKPNAEQVKSKNDTPSSKGVSMSEAYLKRLEDFKPLLILDSKIENFSATGNFVSCNHDVVTSGIKNAETNKDYFLIGEFPKFFQGQNVIVKGTFYNVNNWIRGVIIVDEIKVVELK